MARFAVVYRCSLRVALLGLSLGSAGSGVHADPLVEADSDGSSWHEKTSVDVEPSAETWTGFEGYRRVASLYSGATWSPFSNLRQDGARLRVLGGEGLYRYGGLQFDTGTQAQTYGIHTGTGRFAEAMLGWQISSGGTTAKVFAGYGFASNVVTPFDREAVFAGTAGGAKVALELWHNWSSRTWTSLDVSDARARSTLTALLRSGWRGSDASQAWSIGPELAHFENSATASNRVGVFVRFEALAHEFTVSGGAAHARNDGPTGYISVQYLQRF